MIIVADIGGTRMRIATCDVDAGTVLGEPIIEPTISNYREGIVHLREHLIALTLDEKPEAIVIGLPGIVDSRKGVLVSSPHLGDWSSRHIIQDLQASMKGDVPIYLMNDAALVGLGEAVFGAGKGYESVAYITISTGIGGAKIVNGKVDHAGYGFEPGFQILDASERKTFEQLCSGSAVEERFKTHPRVVAKTLAWQEIERLIAIGLHNTIVHWSPNVLVVGGSMANDLDAERLHEYLAALPSPYPALPDIKLATLDSVGGLHGGIALMRSLN